MMRVGVAGATGYTGQELCRLLWHHPETELTRVFSKNYTGQKLNHVCSNLHPYNLELESLQIENFEDLDVLFLALPHGQTNFFMKELFSTSLKIIDLSADFRLKNVDLFKKHYKIEHNSPELLNQVSLGYPELFRDDIKEKQCCANPGCYSASAIMGLYPLAEKGLLTSTVVIDAKSGVSGAGKTLKLGSLFCEANESIKAYATYIHRHTAEIETVLDADVYFSPHLVPMTRGILTSMYIDNENNLTETDIIEIYKTKYNEEPFILLHNSDEAITTKNVLGSNLCQITIKVLPGSNKIAIFSVIDNLLKGAAGQAVQNMNIMLGIEETLGLSKIAL